MTIRKLSKIFWEPGGYAVLWVALTVAACTPNQSEIGSGVHKTANGVGTVTRLIIAFKADPGSPDSKMFLAALSETAGVPLVYVRPLEPPVHLFATSVRLDAKEREVVMARLSKRQNIRYIEYDRPMHHMELDRRD